MHGVVNPRYRTHITGRERGLLFGSSLELRDSGIVVNREITGLTGISDGALGGAGTASPTSGGNRIHGSGIQFVDDTHSVSAAITATGTKDAGTVIFTALPTKDTSSDAYIFCGDDPKAYYQIRYDAAGQLITLFGDVMFDQYTGADLLVGRSLRIAVTWDDSASEVKVYIDGTNTDTYTSNFLDDMAKFVIGAFSANGNSGFEGYISNGVCYNRVLSANEILQDYLTYGRRAHFNIDFSRFYADGIEYGAAAGVRVANTPFITGPIAPMGSFRVIDTDLHGTPAKAIQSTVTGTLFLYPGELGFFENDPEAAYGTWEWWIKKGSVGGPSVWYIADSDSGIDGYSINFVIGGFIQCKEWAAGALVGTHLTSNAIISDDTWYKITISRRFDGRTTVKVDDDVIVAAGGANPFTDNTVKAGGVIGFGLLAGDEISGFKKLWGEVL